MNHDLRFTSDKIAKRIELIRPLIRKSSHEIPEFRLETLDRPDATPGSGEDQGKVAWHSYWAGQDTHFVLTSAFEIPECMENPALFLPLGVAGDIFTHPEALIRVDGQIIGSADRHHQLVPLDRGLADGGQHDLLLQGWTGLTGWPPDPTNKTRLQISPCAVVDIDTALRDFVALAEVALDVAGSVDDADRVRDRLLQALDAAFLTLDTRHPLGEDFRASVPAALDRLRADIADAGPTIPARLHAIGHAHMDIAYLWPIAQIRQKNARTYSNVLRLMDSYPDFRFSHSQPQLYAYTEADHPELFARIRDRVADGQWEVMGGMWVEPDCNIPGGEALVRQILLGRCYFRDTFGDVETPVLWLPDTFGFPWSLPQLMQQAGLTAFVTNKLNWNQYNRMPSSTTWWQGIDGTRVLAHFLTTPRKVQHLPFPTNYKSDLSAAEVIGTWTNATTGAQLDALPIAYGYGDGGGGPTEGQILKARAYANMPGAPQLGMSTVREAMGAIMDSAEGLPVWNEEFYLEGHRGTLTSQAWIKRANRVAERMLHDAEAALVTAYPAGVDEATRAELKSVWKLLCVNQFHDILTGTSIAEVFEDARRDFDEIARRAASLLSQALATVFPTEGSGALFNPAPVPVAAPVLVPEGGGQVVEGGTLAWADLPAYGTGEVSDAPPDTVRAEHSNDGWTLENTHLRAEVDGDGRLTRVLNKSTGRNVLAPGQDGNQLWAFEDRPISWDAWDIDVFHEDRAERIGPARSIELIETGPLRATIRLKWQWRDSRFSQDIRLQAGSARLDFKTGVDWRERHTLLKVAFPADILSPRATYDIQWGEIERPTHRNTRWDFARFEVPAQKWADLSERGFGVALLNDCKHGYDIRENVIRLSLIKSSTSPDPGADQGQHTFTYALLPHSGDLQQVRAESRRLNDPVIAVADRAPPQTAPIVSCDAPNVIIETLKPAEDGHGFILRLYESDRRRGPVRLRFGPPMAQVSRCDLLEQDTEDVPLADNECTLTLTPFEIVTLRCMVDDA